MVRILQKCHHQERPKKAEQLSQMKTLKRQHDSPLSGQLQSSSVCSSLGTPYTCARGALPQSGS